MRLGFSAKDILVATGKSHDASVRKQLSEIPKKNVLVEPVKRDSAGAIGLAASRVHAQNPEEVLLSVHADSWIDDGKRFIATVKSAESILKKYPNHTLMFGIKPSYPETGYGYIQLNKKVVHQKNNPVYSVKRFIEKPNLAHAQKFAADNKYLWNPGWFAWRVDVLLSHYKKYLPKNYTILKRIGHAPESGLQKTINKEFPKLKSIAIDYGIHEKLKKLLVIPCSLSWADIGHWRSVSEMSKKDRDGNTVAGESVLLDSSNNLLMSSSKKLITAVGVNNLVMIETDGVILLVHKDRAQDVRELIKQFKSNKLKNYL